MHRWLLVALAACGSKTETKVANQTADPKPAVDRCRQVVDHMNELDRKTTGGSGVDPAEADGLVQICKKDWSAALVDCLLAVKDPTSLEACKQFAPKPAQADATSVMVKKLAFEAYPSWAASHPEKECPDKLDDLFEYMSGATPADAWGTPYQMYCGKTLPAGARGLAIVSAGPDGKLGTADDIKSW